VSDIDRQAAFQRMLLAREGAFAGSPSDEFLLELRCQCHAFIKEIDGELARRMARHDAAADAARDELEDEP